MSIITQFLSAAADPQFKLARDLTAMAFADGQITPEEREAVSAICSLEGIDEEQLTAALQGGYDRVDEELPQTRREKEKYLQSIIRLIGADGYAAPQEVYLLQIIASKMGLTQMDVISLVLVTATRQYFKGDTGNRVLASFLKNYIDPKGKTEAANRESLRTIYNTVANNTETTSSAEADLEILRQNLARATQTFLGNKILIKEFRDIGGDFTAMVRQEEHLVFSRYAAYISRNHQP